jgi:uncharacterized RDD family membrane protein YckC
MARDSVARVTRIAVYEIETPENVRIRFERAGLASRALAWVLDLVMMGFLFLLSAVLLSPLQWFSGSAAAALVLIAGFAVQWWYGTLCEWRFAGRTFGKWWLGIAVRDKAGLRLTLGQSAIRNLLRIVDLLPGLYLVGGACALIDPHGRRLGDLAAGTLVIRERHPALPSRLAREVRLQLDHHPELRDVARRLRPTERDAVLALVRERDALPLATRVALFEQLASHFERRFQLIRTPHLSAENLVLYVTAALAEGPQLSVDDPGKAVANGNLDGFQES